MTVEPDSVTITLQADTSSFKAGMERLEAALDRSPRYIPGLRELMNTPTVLDE